MTHGLEHMLRTLAVSHAFAVVAEDGVLGEVETPLFPPDSADPDYLIVRTAGSERSGRRLISIGLVDAADAARREVRVRVTRDEVHALPALLPVAPFGR